MSDIKTLDKKSLSIIKKIKSLETKYQSISQQRDTLKEQLKVSMEKFGIKKWEDEGISITYVAPTIAKTFDSKKFQKDYPQIYQEYLKDQERSASIRITLKGESNV